MIIPIRSEWSEGSVAQLQHSLTYGNIVVPLSPTTRGVQEKLSIIDKAVMENHPAIQSLGGHPGFVLFTSGTTGAPKAALHDFIRFSSKFHGGKPYRTIMFLMFDHIGGWNTLFYTLSAGGVPIYIEDRQPDTVCAAIEREKADLLPTTPTFLRMLLYSQAYKRHDLSSLKVVTYGTEPMPQATLQACREILPQVNFKQTYGLSEVGILGTQSETSDSVWVKVGGHGYETEIREGILWVNSATSMLGYLNAPSPFDSNGWYCTGDRVEKRGEYLHFLGRESEAINVGGVKVSPVEVESVLLEIPGVRDAVVYGEENPLMGQAVAAKVAGEITESEIIRYCRSKLNKWECPVRVEIVQDLPPTERYKKSHPV